MLHKKSEKNFHFVENDNSFDRESIEKLAEFSVERVTPRLLSISDTDSASSPAFHKKPSNYFISSLILQKKTRLAAQKIRLVVRKQKSSNQLNLTEERD